jgi:hypothetical protein
MNNGNNKYYNNSNPNDNMGNSNNNYNNSNPNNNINIDNNNYYSNSNPNNYNNNMGNANNNYYNNTNPNNNMNNNNNNYYNNLYNGISNNNNNFNNNNYNNQNNNINHFQGYQTSNQIYYYNNNQLNDREIKPINENIYNDYYINKGQQPMRSDDPYKELHYNQNNNLNYYQNGRIDYPNEVNNINNSLINDNMDYKIQGPNSEQNNIPLRPNASDNANYTFNELNNYRQGSNKCQNKCIYCSMYIDNNNIDICKTCFKHRLIEELHRISLEYESINVLEVLEPNIEIQLRKNEQKKEYALSQILNIYNSNFINENLDKNRLIKEIKKETCVYCNGQINNEKYTLPCNCSLCSKKHLHKYINEMDLTKGPCNCCHYTNKMMFDLGVLLNSLNCNLFIKF